MTAPVSRTARPPGPELMPPRMISGSMFALNPCRMLFPEYFPLILGQSEKSL